MIHTIENIRKITFGRIGFLLIGMGMYLSLTGVSLMGVAITTLFAVDLVLTLKEESV
tara:strand:- start:197 stop:367 length:171 start_codon:yes stop_codon:yes gene_type:complete